MGPRLPGKGVARSVAFVTPRIGPGEREGNWIASVLAADTAAIYMGAGEAGAISAALIAAGKPADTPAAVVENASSPGLVLQATTLRGLPNVSFGSGPALILLGEVYRDLCSGVRPHYKEERYREAAK